MRANLLNNYLTGTYHVPVRPIVPQLGLHWKHVLVIRLASPKKYNRITDQRVNFDADYNYITRMKILPLSLLALVLIIVAGDIPHLNKKQINQLIDDTKINYGSTVRIKANAFAY